MKPFLSAFVLMLNLFFSLSSYAQNRVMYQNPQTNAQDGSALLAAPPPSKGVIMLCSCPEVGDTNLYKHRLVVLTRNQHGEFTQFFMGEFSKADCNYAIYENPACPKN